MPTYDYVCHHCGHRFEVIHGVHADGPSHCPVCHKSGVRKAISAPSVVFKGSGWAKKDRSSTSRPAPSTASSDSTAAKSTTEGGSSGSEGSDSSNPTSTKPAVSGSTTPAGGTAD
jgi:putative FmdB family regulatory protein